MKLLLEDDPDLLTITNISKRSGYSIGNIYHYFKNIDSVLEEFLINRSNRRTEAMIKLINETPASITAIELAKLLNDSNFLFMTKLPKVMFMKLTRLIIMTRKDAIERLDEGILKLADPIEALINRNESNTFKKLKSAEIELSLLMCSSALRKAIIANHKLALTKSHQELSLAVMIALLAK